ncbi:hypothetical protein GCM10020000_71130 [Streptomyces olivoverticillatus]
MIRARSSVPGRPSAFRITGTRSTVCAVSAGTARLGGTVDLQYTPGQQRLRAELREYFAALVPDGAYERHADPAERKSFYRRTIRRLGADGRLGVGWPEEYGGSGLTPMEQFIFFDEAAQAGVPLPLMALNTVGPTLMQFGTDEQKSHFLPRILSGEIDFAIGYSEPGAGTDLASLTTRAVREGDGYLVNGQKIWTTNGDTADWVWLAVRTAPRGRGGPAPQGHQHPAGPHQRPWLLLHPHQHPRLARHHREPLRQHPRPALPPRGGGEPGVAADHHPAQP